jgi:hypothetical protein
VKTQKHLKLRFENKDKRNNDRSCLGLRVPLPLKKKRQLQGVHKMEWNHKTTTKI